MRLAKRFGFFYKILFIEAAIIFSVCAIFYSQFQSAKSDVINKAVLTSEFIGEEAANFIIHTKNPTSAEFHAFLRSKHGQNGVFKLFNVTPTSFRVMFTKEYGNGRGADFSFEKGYGIRDAGKVFSVSVPFLPGADGTPYGFVTINSSKGMIMRQVIENNFLLYIALFIVLNNQVFILRYYASRKRKDIVNKNYVKPYLKQHSIGALKVMRKILDEIVEDHPDDAPRKKVPKTDDETGKGTGSKKIVSISQFLSRERQ